jgi:hypothetical protein
MNLMPNGRFRIKMLNTFTNLMPDAVLRPPIYTTLMSSGIVRDKMLRTSTTPMRNVSSLKGWLCGHVPIEGKRPRSTDRRPGTAIDSLSLVIDKFGICI